MEQLILKLAAFADEISPDLDEQIRVCQENAVTRRFVRLLAATDLPPIRLYGRSP